MSAFAIYTHNKHLYAFKKTKRLKTQHIIQYCVFNLIIYQSENWSDYTILAYRITR